MIAGIVDILVRQFCNKPQTASNKFVVAINLLLVACNFFYKHKAISKSLLSFILKLSILQQ
jgi:hypothetical protein